MSVKYRDDTTTTFYSYFCFTNNNLCFTLKLLFKTSFMEKEIIVSLQKPQNIILKIYYVKISKSVD